MSAYDSSITWTNVEATGIKPFSTRLMLLKCGKRNNMELLLMVTGVLGVLSR
jgi:hypothetical protein